MSTRKTVLLIIGGVSAVFAVDSPNAAPGTKIVVTDGPPAVSSPMHPPSVSAAASAAPVAAAPAATPHPFTIFPIYTDAAPQKKNYVASGYMGDSDLSVSGAFVPTPHGTGPCLRVNYKASGPKGWAGLYWQNPANNWGDAPGHAGYDLRGATKLTFWARGESGGERIHEFRVGGIVGQYPDSDVARLTNIRLTKDWTQYSIDLSKKDLRHIIGGFGVFVNKFECSGGAMFFLDDIVFEGPQGVMGSFPLDAGVGKAVTPPAPPQPPAPVAVAPTPGKDLVVKEESTGLKVSFSSRLMFQSGKAILEPASEKVLDQLVSLLSAYPKNRVLIEGHTDNTGDKDFNLRLSDLRAKTVRDYLIKHGGFEESRFQAVGYGDTKPIGDNGTKAGRLMNRRVEVTILKGATP